MIGVAFEYSVTAEAVGLAVSATVTEMILLIAVAAFVCV